MSAQITTIYYYDVSHLYIVERQYKRWHLSHNLVIQTCQSIIIIIDFRLSQVEFTREHTYHQ